MKKRRDAWLCFNAPAIALPAYIDCGTVAGSPCASPARRPSSRLPEPTLADPLTLLQARTPKTLHHIIPASPITSSSWRASQPSTPACPAWKGWAEVSHDYIPSGSSLISDIPICTACTCSKHSRATVIAKAQGCSSRHVSGRKSQV
jgi:hypothetical protein